MSGKVLKTPVTRMEMGEAQLVIYALSGTIEALTWIDEGQLDDSLNEDQIHDARCNLLLASRRLIDEAKNRF